MDIKTKETLVKNVRMLMKERQWTQPELGKKSGVSQKTIHNLLNTSAEGQPRLDIIEKIANAFGLQLWHLCIPDLPPELLKSKSIEKLIEYYSHANKEGRERIHYASLKQRCVIIQ